MTNAQCYLFAFLRGLCDITNQGRLNSEQFALAMYLIHQKVMGVDPPQTLSPEMVPPSMRSGGAVTPAGGEERVMFFGSFSPELLKRRT